MARFRSEHDSLGTLQVPIDALYGAQTQRAVENFPISGIPMPRSFLRALALIKAAAAQANGALGVLPTRRAQAIEAAALLMADDEFDDQFPIDVFQTGSGTSSNMNANEVIASVAAKRSGRPVHPNDDVNASQSSNDVIPSAIQLSALLLLNESLLPAIKHLKQTIDKRGRGLNNVIKTGRTHLMDAMPLTMAQELSGWSAQLGLGLDRLNETEKRLRDLPLGGTAVGTGVNADPRFAARAIAALSKLSGERLKKAANAFAGMASQDVAVELSGQLNTLACTLMKIANDLRWMNSGPLAGLGEITLPTLQPGSSIMPGKVNPVIPEAVAMVCAQVIGNHATITVAGQSGNFQLNVMLPVIAYNLIQSLELLSNASRLLADKAINKFTINRDRIEQALDRNPILVTSLNTLIGYEKAAQIAKAAYAQQRPIIDMAAQMTDIPIDKLKRLLDPKVLTRGGMKKS